MGCVAIYSGKSYIYPLCYIARSDPSCFLGLGTDWISRNKVSGSAASVRRILPSSATIFNRLHFVTVSLPFFLTDFSGLSSSFVLSDNPAAVSEPAIYQPLRNTRFHSDHRNDDGFYSFQKRLRHYHSFISSSSLFSSF